MGINPKFEAARRAAAAKKAEAEYARFSVFSEIFSKILMKFLVLIILVKF